MTPSVHLNKRIKRTGLNKKGYRRFLANACTRGLLLDDLPHNSDAFVCLKSLVSERHYAVIYDRYLILVSKDDDTGITILNIPNKIYNKLNVVGGSNGERSSYKNSQETEDEEVSPDTEHIWW